MNTAARNGHLSVVQFLHEHRTEGCTNPVMNKATKFGHLEIVKFLHKNRTEGCTYEAIDEASSNGHVEIVRYLVEQANAPYSQYAVEWAASRGHLDVLQYFHEHIPLLSPREWIRYEATTFAMDEAAARGFLDIVRSSMKIDQKAVPPTPWTRQRRITTWMWPNTSMNIEARATRRRRWKVGHATIPPRKSQRRLL